MSSPFELHLLRRTLVALAALGALGFATAAQAQGTVTLSGASGNNCSYSTMSITPNGNVVVTCTGTQQPPVDQPGTFSFASASQSVAAGASASSVTVQVGRTGGTMGAFRVVLGPNGAACWGQPDHLDVADGASGGSFQMTVGNVANTFCEMHMLSVTPLGSTTGATLGTTKVHRVSVGSGNPTTTLPPGCPAVPENMISRTWPGGPGNPFGTINTPALLAASGQITSIPLPKMVAASGELVFFELAGSPDPTPIEISINRCPGVIDTDTNNRCNVRTVSRFNNKITWFERAFSVIADSNSANERGYCWAGDPSVTQYYINARWSYSACPFGMQVCGYGAQYNLGPY